MIKSLRNIVLIPYLLLLFSSLAAVKPTIAREVNTAYFTKAPRLLGASTTYSGVRVRYAKYYFNVEIPKDAGNHLQQIVIAQRQGQEEIEFRLDETVAYLGTNRNKEEQIAIAEVIQNEETGEIKVILENPIPPDTTFTVALKPRRNPFFDGVYLFGVTVFPQGDDPTGLYLGAGRLQFYRGNDGFIRN